MPIKIYDNRIVIPNSIKLSNMYENRSKYLEFDFTDVITKGNKYLVCKHESEQTFKTPLLLSDDKLLVKTFMNARPGTYKSLIIISDTTIDDNYDFSSDNLLFVSNMFDLIVDENFLNGSSKEWELPDSINIKFDELLALISKVNEDLDSGAFNGVGIDSISKKSTQGNVDTYTITFTNGETFEYNVTNGVDGKSPIVTIQNGNWFVNGEDTGQKAQGDKGERGEQGKSAYQVALDNGFVGTEQEWLDSLDYEHSDEFTQLANQVNQDAQTSTQAVETVTQLKTDVEDKATEFEQTVQNANDNFDNKVNQANSDLDTKIQQANTTIDEKVTEATSQAEKAKEEANRATLATDGKLDKNQGTDNVGKVMIVGEDGELTPTEYKSGSDNKLIGTVTKSENPNITDGYQAEMMNLKLYGKSTQGSDPSPTSPQEITAISQFEGNVFAKNLFNLNVDNLFNKRGAGTVENYENGVKFSFNNIRDSAYQLNIELEKNTQYTIEFDVVRSASETSPYTSVIFINTVLNVWYDSAIGCIYFKDISNNHAKLTFTTDANLETRIFISGNNNITSTGYTIFTNFIIAKGSTDTSYTPYQEPIPFTYTPTNPMYSTQDGSISDYVDVEKGVEVYNMGIATDLAQESWGINSQNDEFIKFQLLGNYPLMNNVTDNPILCNMFMQINVSQADLLNQEGIAKGSNGYILQIVLNKSRGILTVEDFKAFIQEMVVVYLLATPTEIPINPIQLAILKALYTYNGVTNFLCNSDVSFDYEQSLQIVIQNIWNAIGQTNANILLGGNQ